MHIIVILDYWFSSLFSKCYD